MFHKRKRSKGPAERKKVYVLHGYWEMPCEDHGVNVWAVGEDDMKLASMMHQIGDDMVRKAKEEYGVGFVCDIGKWYYEADDLEGNFVNLYITMHTLENYQYDGGQT